MTTANHSGSPDDGTNHPCGDITLCATGDCLLFMDCSEDSLTDIQLSVADYRAKSFRDQMARLEAMAKAGAQVTSKANGSYNIRVTETSVVLSNPTTNQESIIADKSSTVAPMSFSALVSPVTVPTRLPQCIRQAGVPIPKKHSSTKHGPGYRFLMDSKTGKILGTLNASNSSQIKAKAGLHSIVKTTSFGSSERYSESIKSRTGPGIASDENIQKDSKMSKSSQGTFQMEDDIHRKISTTNSSCDDGSLQVVDLTQSSLDPSEKIKVIKPSFPELNVVPKSIKTVHNIASKRTELDCKVKSVLVHPPAKFTEWLIRNGLVFSEQIDGQNKMKLGMFSDPKKFSFSGGYVWVTEKCASKYISVYKGSIFEATSHHPTIIVKLLYHWCCQTNVSNIKHWVKVDEATINTYFRIWREICGYKLQTETAQLGGKGKKVEIGVISLGTTSSDGNRKEVKVEILGVLDRSTGTLRLRATKPSTNVSQAGRFLEIFRPLKSWVQASSEIVTDLSIDKTTLQAFGFQNITQTQESENSNFRIMEYLKNAIPKMFQNTLSILSTTSIQQCLDELTFREVWGCYPLQCFDAMMICLSNITEEAKTKKSTVLSQLKNTSIISNKVVEQSLKRQVDKKTGLKHPKRQKHEEIFLESYYYGCLEGDKKVMRTEFKADMALKCPVCKKLFMNNIDFMRHLSLHVDIDRAYSTDLVDILKCHFCLQEFENTSTLEEHTKIHNNNNFPFFCKICLKTFDSKLDFLRHMSRTHVKLELPFVCGICSYRSSFHSDILDHFSHIHERTDKLLCPKCLKIYSLFTEKGYLPCIPNTYIDHLQLHLKREYRCSKCCLSFLSEFSLKQHIEKDHVSFCNIQEVEKKTSVIDTKMPVPDEMNIKFAQKKAHCLKPLIQKSFVAQNFEDLAFYNLDDENCLECKTSLSKKDHLGAFLCCTQCQYSTCCSKASYQHYSNFHEQNRKFKLGKPIILKKTLFCICGFYSCSGNKIAKHLVLCDRRTAIIGK